MKLSYLYILILAYLFNSCRPSIEPDNKKTLNELVKRYSKLYGQDQLDQYKIVRKLYNADSIEIQLLEHENSSEQIIILSNTKGQVYAIPFPDNNNKAYWRFYGDTVYNETADKTINAAIHAAFDLLSIRGWKTARVFNDIFSAIMQSQSIRASDSLRYRIDQSLADSCRAASKNNFHALYNNINYIIGDHNLTNTYHDWQHGRYFQLEHEIIYSDKRNIYKFIVYRQPCITEKSSL